MQTHIGSCVHSITELLKRLKVKKKTHCTPNRGSGAPRSRKRCDSWARSNCSTSPASHKHDPARIAARGPCLPWSSSTARHHHTGGKREFDYSGPDKRLAYWCHTRTRATLVLLIVELVKLKWKIYWNAKNNIPTHSTRDSGLFSSSPQFCTQKPNHVGFIFLNEIYIYHIRWTVAIINEAY